MRRNSVDVRQAAAEALGKIGDARVVEPLIAALKDTDKDVRQAAAVALGKIGDARAVEPLIAALKDEERDVRAVATEALVKIGTLAVEPLIAALKDRDSDVRQAAYVLGEIGDARAVEPLIAALGDERSDVRQAAAKALDHLGWKPAQDESAGWYWMAKRDWDKCVALGALAMEPLIAALKDAEWRVHHAAAEALVKIGAPAVEPLIAALKDAEWRVRLDAAYALGKIGDTRAVEPLIAAIKDRDSDVREAAAYALGAIGDARAVAPLIAALKDEEWDVRWAAAHALDRLGWKPEQDEIAGWYWMAKRDWDKCVALGSFAVEPLIAALKDKDSDVREAAAVALDHLGWKPAQDESAGWYWMAKRDWGKCVALGALAVEPLIAALKHKDSDVRKVAAEALGEIKDPRAVEPLIAALKDKDSDVRKAAAEALVSLYRNASLSETAKQTILAYRSKITSPHTDNWGSCSGHTDSGIGVYFPL
jgi:HEAT repeat protein